MAADILEKIIANKRLEVSRQQEAISIDMLLHAELFGRRVYSMKEALRHSPSGIIAEFKRRSPSKGWIHPGVNVKDVVPGYAASGASAVSVLTDERFFGGTLSDFFQARKLVQLPLLRKEFMISEYQIYQSKAMGADAILLIAAALSKDQVLTFSRLAHDLGLEVLLEIHQEHELDYLVPEIDLVGVNNRNLGTFETSVENSFRLIEQLPSEQICISESGISDPQTARALRSAGYRGFLMGETFMKHPHPDAALAGFIQQITL